MLCFIFSNLQRNCQNNNRKWIALRIHMHWTLSCIFANVVYYFLPFFSGPIKFSSAANTTCIGSYSSHFTTPGRAIAWCHIGRLVFGCFTSSTLDGSIVVMMTVAYITHCCLTFSPEIRNFIEFSIKSYYSQGISMPHKVIFIIWLFGLAHLIIFLFHIMDDATFWTIHECDKIYWLCLYSLREVNNYVTMYKYFFL